ncbi:MAG: hypothetical protein WCY33_03830, partial [Clostridia bacterium]
MRKILLLLFVVTLILSVCFLSSCKDKDPENGGTDTPPLTNNNEYEINLFDRKGNVIQRESIVYLQVSTGDPFSLKIVSSGTKAANQIILSVDNSNIISLSKVSFALDPNKNEENFSFIINALEKGSAEITVSFGEYIYQKVVIRVIKNVTEIKNILLSEEQLRLGSRIDLSSVLETFPLDSDLDTLRFRLKENSQSNKYCEIIDGELSITGVGEITIIAESLANPEVKKEKTFNTRFSSDAVAENIEFELDGEEASSENLKKIKELTLNFSGETEPISLVDVKALTSLEKISITSGEYNTLDFSENINIKEISLSYSGTGLNSLNIKDLEKLKKINISKGSIKEFSLINLPQLESFDMTSGSVEDLKIDNIRTGTVTIDLSNVSITNSISIKNISQSLDIKFKTDVSEQLSNIELDNLNSFLSGENALEDYKYLPNSKKITINRVKLSSLDTTYNRLLSEVIFEELNLDTISSNYFSETYKIPPYAKIVKLKNWQTLSAVDLLEARDLTDLTVQFETHKKTNIVNTEGAIILDKLVLDGLSGTKVFKLNIPSLKEISISNFQNIETVDLSGTEVIKNNLERVDLGYGMESLRILLLDNNNLSELDLTKVSSTIEELSIENNGITNLSLVNRLRKLNLSGNNGVSVSNISQKTLLEYLNVSGCNLSSMPSISTLKNLYELNLCNNQLNVNLEYLYNITGLKRIDFSGNSLSKSILDDYFNHMSSNYSTFCPEYIDYSFNNEDSRLFLDSLKNLFDKGSTTPEWGVAIYSIDKDNVVHNYYTKKIVEYIIKAGAAIRISENIKKAIFSEVEAEISNFSIIVEERETDLDIELVDFKFNSSGYGLYCENVDNINITAYGNNLVKSNNSAIYSTGNVYIYGDLDSDLVCRSVGNGSGGGYDGISCTNLTIDSLGLVEIFGANGEDGSNGSIGQNGQNGKDGGNAITCSGTIEILSAVKLKSGNGGDGGNGGN